MISASATLSPLGAANIVAEAWEDERVLDQDLTSASQPPNTAHESLYGARTPLLLESSSAANVFNEHLPLF